MLVVVIPSASRNSLNRTDAQQIVTANVCSRIVRPRLSTDLYCALCIPVTLSLSLFLFLLPPSRVTSAAHLLGGNSTKHRGGFSVFRLRNLRLSRGTRPLAGASILLPRLCINRSYQPTFLALGTPAFLLPPTCQSSPTTGRLRIHHGVPP